MWASQLHKHKPVKRPLLMHLNSNRDHLCIMRCTISTEFVMSLFMPQVTLSRTSYATGVHVDKTDLPLLFLWECLYYSTFFFFNPLLKECHSCSANTEYVFMCIPSPVLIPSPISAWHTHSQPLLYRHMDKTQTHSEYLTLQQYTCTIWLSFLTSMLYV